LFAPRTPDANNPSQRMRKAICGLLGQRLHRQRIATVEPVFANIRHHKRLSRFALRGKAEVSTQWQLWRLAHNVGKIARYG
jgi:Transposase DDE domain